MLKVKQAMAVALVMATLVSQTGCADSYLARLMNLRGSYSTYNCIQYVLAAARITNKCTARQMYDGCLGQAKVAGQVANLDELKKFDLKNGDIIAFNHAHVAAYVNGEFRDSDFIHSGIGKMQPRANDAWFAGPIRILRWRMQ